MVSPSILCLFFLFVVELYSSGYSYASLLDGMLYPKESESRQLSSLDGMWNFRVDNSPSRNASFEEKWYTRPLSSTGPTIPMPVPSSYNDITQNKQLRDFVGWAWYDREFYVSIDWSTKKRIILRFDSAHYYTIVWVNSIEVMRHIGGHLPFEAVVNHCLNFDGANRVTVAVNNTLLPHTLPPGQLKFENDPKRYPPGYFVQVLQFDFFNYAGIHRHVRLYTTPHAYVNDITITTSIKNNIGIVDYIVKVTGDEIDSTVVEIVDKDGNSVATSIKLKDSLSVNEPHLWWPYSMNATSYGYQYTLKVSVRSAYGMTDVYRQPFGIRTVTVTDSQILINNKPFYCHGVGKHEDSDIRGKGLDYALIAKDFNMMKWLGVNCFRTSHYPYAEEIMDQADRQGIVVIDESPGVGITRLENFQNASLNHHLEVMEELVRRDKNRPAVIMWSVANEPASTYTQAAPYFKAVIDKTHHLDSSRPVTFVCNQSPLHDLATQFVDVLCFNHYFAWYSDVGHTELIQMQLSNELEEWRARFKKPIIMTEYGADTVVGLHMDPSWVFTEEFQVELMKEYHVTFDKYRKQYLAGEMIWNFADFMTDQSIQRVVGNKKGVLTRQRQPKMSAHLLRERYHKLLNETLCSQE